MIDDSMYPLKPELVYRLWKKIDSFCRRQLLSTQVPKRRGNLFEDTILRFLRELNFHPPIAGRASPIEGVSSVRHEHDIVIRPPKVIGNDFLLVECKYRKKGTVVTKEDIMIFNQKATDIYLRGKIREAKIRNLYRLFISNVPFDHDSFRICLTYGILVLQPLYSRILYPSDVASYPPLQAVLRNIRREPKVFDASISKEIEDIEQDTLRLMKLTFRATSAVPPSTGFNGDILERKYLDIVLRMNAYVREW